MSITKDAKSAKKDRGLDFRFLDKRDIKTDKEKADDIKELKHLKTNWTNME